MNAEKVLKSINLIVSKYAPNASQSPEFEALAQSLREEIALAEQKKSGKADRFKAALRFSKKCNKEQRETRPYMAGAYIDEKGRQCIFHPAMAVRYEVPFDGLVEAEEGERPDVLDRVMSTYDRSKPLALPELGHLKTMLKLDKAEGNLDDGRSITELDGVTYNTEYLIQLIECVEPTEAYFSGPGKFPILVVFGEGAQGVVCPVKAKGRN